MIVLSVFARDTTALYTQLEHRTSNLANPIRHFNNLSFTAFVDLSNIEAITEILKWAAICEAGHFRHWDI